MEPLKKAYETLGLPEDATREQVENRYFILMKRARAEQSRTNVNEETPALDLGEVNNAYNIIIGIESGKAGTIEKQSKYAHFMYYYKFHVIISIVVVLIVGYMLKEGIDRRRELANLPPASTSVSVFGNFYFVDVEKLEEDMLGLIPEWERIELFHTYVPKEIKSEQDMAMQQKSILSLMTQHSNLYILDHRNFTALVSQGAFIKLEELEGWKSLNVNPDELVSAQSEEDTAPVSYGIDITGNPIFNEIEVTGERLILAIRYTDKKWEETRMLLEKIIQATP